MATTKQTVPGCWEETSHNTGLGKNTPSLGLAVEGAAQAAPLQPNEGGDAAPKQTDEGSDTGGDTVAPRLESRTHLNQGSYSVCLRNYGDGVGEVGWSFVSAYPLAPKAAKGESENRRENEDRCLRRARSRIRQLILASGADHLLTLTYRANQTDFVQAASDLKKFVRLLKARIPGWLYVAVAENQKRGAWHWHLAVVGRQDVNLLRSLWRQVVGEGNIDVNPPKGNAARRRLALVKYLGKYLAKGFLEGMRELNDRRFRSSLGIPVPIAYLTVPDEARSDVAGYALNQLKIATGEVGFAWVPDDRPSGWACSWS